jgi:hypothetical protein
MRERWKPPPLLTSTALCERTISTSFAENKKAFSKLTAWVSLRAKFPLAADPIGARRAGALYRAAERPAFVGTCVVRGSLACLAPD